MPAWALALSADWDVRWLSRIGLPTNLPMSEALRGSPGDDAASADEGEGAFPAAAPRWPIAATLATECAPTSRNGGSALCTTADEEAGWRGREALGSIEASPSSRGFIASAGAVRLSSTEAASAPGDCLDPGPEEEEVGLFCAPVAALACPAFAFAEPPFSVEARKADEAVWACS